jgi:hypothetical protein
MKRFTDTNKWRDPWFRRLSQTAKLFFVWLTDNCDNAGVIDIDLESASFDIGKPVNGEHFSEIESRLKKLPNGKFWIVKFVGFQYGDALSERCTPHLRVIELLRSHGLNYPECVKESTTLPTTLPTRVETTLKTRQEKDKEQDKTSTGGVGEVAPSKSDVLKAKLCAWFNRRLTTPWSEKEDRALRAVLTLETPQEDFEVLEAYYLSNDPYRRRDILTLLNNWNGEIDRAKGKKNGSHKQELKPTDRNFGVGQDPAEAGRIAAAAVEQAGH